MTTIYAKTRYGYPNKYSKAPETLSVSWIYNNLFNGDTGNNITGHIFLESGISPWTDVNGNAKIFNNVLKSTRQGGCLLYAGGGKDLIVTSIPQQRQVSLTIILRYAVDLVVQCQGSTIEQFLKSATVSAKPKVISLPIIVSP